MAPILSWALCQKKKVSWHSGDWMGPMSWLCAGHRGTRLVIHVRWSTLWVLQGTTTKTIASFWFKNKVVIAAARSAGSVLGFCAFYWRLSRYNHSKTNTSIKYSRSDAFWWLCTGFRCYSLHMVKLIFFNMAGYI